MAEPVFGPCCARCAKAGGTESALDIGRVETISAALPQGHHVTFNVNRAWQTGVAIEVMSSIKARKWVKQPCETLDQFAHVADRVFNPIMLAVCMDTFTDHLDAWRRGACEGVKVKPNRLSSWLWHDHLTVDPPPGQGARNPGDHVVPPSTPSLD